MRANSQLIGHAAMGKALVCSYLLHFGGMICAACISLSEPLDQISSPRQRSVIFATVSHPQIPCEPVDAGVEFNPQLHAEPDEHDPSAATAARLNAKPRELTATKQETSVAVKRSINRAAHGYEMVPDEHVAYAAPAARRVNESADSTNKVAKAPRQFPPRRGQLPPLTTAAGEQVEPAPIATLIEPNPVAQSVVSFDREETDTSLDFKRSSSHKVPRHGERLVHVAAHARRMSELTDAPNKPAEVSPHSPRPVVASPIPRPAIAVQAASAAAKTLPDFAGNQKPPYPVEAIRLGLEGTVILRLHISSTGRVEHVEVSKSSGHAILDRVAAATVSRWQGRPAERAGNAVATVELLPIRFRLRR